MKDEVIYIKTTEYSELMVQKVDGIALLTINSAKNSNSFSCALLEKLDTTIDKLNEDPSVTVVIITGVQKVFVAGADITYMKDLNVDEAINYAKQTTRIYEKMLAARKIYIAAVNGFALGAGTEFALACDLRIGSKNAKFGFPEVKLGIIPGGGGTQRLTRLIGYGKAKELILTGTIINAEEAHALGLINQIVSEEELIKEAFSMASKIMEVGPLSIGYAKECINKSEEMGVTVGIEFEKNLFGACFATEDQKEGMRAFVEKRKPKFKRA